MSRGPKWTIEEERTLIDQVKRHANNLSEAFRTASRLLGRTEGACVHRWYTIISKREDPSVCLVTIGYKTKNINRKIVHAKTTDNTEVTTVSWWRKVIKLLLYK